MNENELDELVGLNKSTNQISAIVCEQCGSSEVEIKTEELAICKHCGTSITLERNIINNFITNINGISNADIESKKLKNYFLVKSSITKEQFLKEVYFRMSIHPKTPSDVLTAQFNEVELKNVQYMVVTAHYEGHYSASIGYDRKEQYEDYEKYYDSKLGMNLTRKVIKTRTVIDWNPISGIISSEETSCVKLGEADNVKEPYNDRYFYKEKINNEEPQLFLSGLPQLHAENKLIEINKENLKNIEILKPSNNDMVMATVRGEYLANKRVSLPGDHIKDYDSSISHTIKNTENYIVPEYSISYQYKNEKLSLCSFAHKLDIMGKIPDVSKDINDKIKSKTRMLGILSLIISVLCIVNCIVLSSTRNGYLFIFEIVLLLSSIIFYILYKKKFESTSKNVKESIFNEKISNLEKFLAEKGLPPLTNKEKEIVEQERRKL